MATDPSFDHPFVQRAWDCFAQRRKSFRHGTFRLTVNWSTTQLGSQWFEYGFERAPFRFWVAIHDLPGIDVEIIRIHEPRAGRKLVRIHDMPVFLDPRPLRDAFEHTISALRDVDSVHGLAEHWERLRARAID